MVGSEERLVAHEAPLRTLASGRFELLRLLGSGSLGDVYEAFDREDERRVALRELRQLPPEEQLGLRRILRSLQALEHPNLVRVGELFEEHGQWLYPLELIEGSDFVEHVQRASRGPAALAEALTRSALLQLLAGLEALHAEGRVHGNLKPSNVLVAKGRVVLLDHGIVDALPSTAARQGNGAYMAPEQMLSGSVEPPADFYALGVILYLCLTGRYPFAGSRAAVLEAKLTQVPPPPHEVNEHASRELSSLCSELLRADPAQRPNLTEIKHTLRPPEPLRRGGAPELELFTGRTRELASLRAAFDASRDKCKVVLIRGASGVGKTQLMQRFAGTLRQQHDDLVVLSGRCYERESLAYKAMSSIVDALEALLSTLSAKQLARVRPQNAALLTRAFPVLTSVLSGEPEPRELVPDQLRQRTFLALRELLTKLARERRLLLTIDDMQWADADSIALLRALIEPPSAPKVMWLLVARRAADAGVDLASLGDLRTIELNALAPQEAEELLGKLLPASALEGTTPPLFAQIAREAKGHPLLLWELVHRGSPTAANDVGLDDVLWARVVRLAPRLREVVEVLAAAGVPLDRDVLSGVLRSKPGELVEAVAHLQGEHLVRTVAASNDQLICIFHDQLRASVLANLPVEQRRKWHRRLAESMERRPHPDTRALSYHFQESGNLLRAAEYVERAADEASQQLAFERCATLLEQLLTLRKPQGDARVAILRRLADAWELAGHGEKSATVRLELAEQLRGFERTEQRRIAAEELLTSGHYQQGQALLRSVIAEAGLRYPETPARALLGLLTRRTWLTLRGLKFTPTRPQLALQRRVPVDVTWTASAGLTLHEAMRGRYFQASNLLAALALGEPGRIVRALCFEALSSGESDPQRGAALLAAARPLAYQLDTPAAHAQMAVAEGGLASFLGQWERAQELLMRAEVLYAERCQRVRYELGATRSLLYGVLAARGQLPTLRAHLLFSMRDAEERNDRYALTTFHGSPMVLLSLADDDVDAAAAHLAEARRHLHGEEFRMQHALCMLSAAQVELYRDRPREALAIMQEAWPALERSLLLRVTTIRIRSHDMLARCALATATVSLRQRQPALVLARRSVAALRSERGPWARCLLEALQGTLCALEQRLEPCTAHLTRAQALARQHGMALHEAALHRALSRVVGGGEARAHRERADVLMHTAGVISARRLSKTLLAL